jgi:hypothetical protein
MTTQPEALRLADQLGARYSGFPSCDEAAAELRRLHAVNQELLDALQVLCRLALSGESVLWTAEYDRARAAIAKAEGQA